jgi:hypothetical protein
MSKITVTAADGVRAKVTVQKLETHTRAIPELKDSAGRVVAPGETQTFDAFADKSVVTFASEARVFEVNETTRILVEEQPAAEGHE